MSAFLYNGLIEHHRHKPRDHQFSYPLYVYGFDLEELPELDRRLPFFGHNRFRPASVHDKDYLDSGPGTIREKLDRFLAKEGFGDAVARAFLITSPRYFNYVFNPVSFYYLFAADGALVGNVAEVNNTFGEKHLYILRSPDRGNGDHTATYRTEKAFHVSPFNRIEGTYEFSFADISKELDVGINIRQAGRGRLRGPPPGNARAADRIEPGEDVPAPPDRTAPLRAAHPLRGGEALLRQEADLPRQAGAAEPHDDPHQPAHLRAA